MLEGGLFINHGLGPTLLVHLDSLFEANVSLLIVISGVVRRNVGQGARALLEVTF
jgi:hypothetical protein